MTAPSSRLLPTGQLYTQGLDEATFNPDSGYKKNLFTYSNNLSAWSASNLSVIPAPAPDGTMTAFKVVDNSVNSFHYLSQAVTGTVWNGVHTISFWAKAAENYVCAIEIVWAPGGISGLGVTYNLLTGVAVQSPYGQGTAGTATMIDKGNGWYYCTLTYNNLNNFYNATTSYVRWPEVWAGASPYVVYQGNGTNGLYVWQPQLEIGPNATIYEATDFAGNPVNTAGLASRIANTGLYVTGGIDEATYNPVSGYSQNLVAYSQTAQLFSNQNGQIFYATPTYTAPDGTQTAYKISEDTVSTNHYGGPYITQTMSIGVPYTWSIYLKKGPGTTAPDWIQLSVQYQFAASTYVNFNLSTGTLQNYSAASASITPVGKGWYRCSMTFISTSSTAVSGSMNCWLVFINNSNTLGRLPVYPGSPTSDVLLWGPQFEPGTSASRYVPTDATGKPINSAGFVQTVTNQGRHYVTGNYDEVSGILSTTNGLIANFDTYIPGTFTTTSPTTWTDSTDSRYYGVYQNFQNQSKFNPTLGAFNFDGITNGTGNAGFNVTNQANSVTLDKFYTPAFSMEIWARCTSFNVNVKYNNILALWEYYQVSGFRCGISTPNGLSTDTTGRPVFWTDQSGGNFSLDAATYPIALNTWFQVLVTYDGSTCNLYFNGTLFATKAVAIFKNPGKTAPMYIAGNNNGCQSFNGQMSIFRWYNRGLTATEAADNFAGNRSRFGI